MRVRYECSKCSWRNEELPYGQDDLKDFMTTDDRLTSYFNDSIKTSSITSAVY
jgi:hypothetical protein